MKKKIFILLAIILFTGCSEPSLVKHNDVKSTEEKNNKDKNSKDEEQNNNNNNNNTEDKREVKEDDKNKTNTSDSSDKSNDSSTLNDTYSKNFENKLLDEGFIKKNEDVKGDYTWNSVIKYVKPVKGGSYVVFVNKANNIENIKNLENSTGYKGSTLLESKAENVKVFENKDERFALLVAYNEKEGNGIIFMVNGKPQDIKTDDNLEYGKKLLSDLIK